MSDDIEDIIKERGYRYGSPDDFNEQLRLVWTGLLRRQLQPHVELSKGQCVAMMLAFKSIRCMNNVDYADSWIDAAGYATIGEMFSSTDIDRTLQLIKDHDERTKED
jgi:hypothetical protein